MARHHLINGIRVPFTAQEEAEWDANEAAHAAKKAKESNSDKTTLGDIDALADLKQKMKNKS